MGTDRERMEWVERALEDAGLDALVCAVPENVRMLTGYWPVVGTAIALAAGGGRFAVLVPEDERDLAEEGWAEVRTYSPGSLTAITSPVEAARQPLADLLSHLNLQRGRIGIEDTAVFEPSTYAAMYLFGAEVRELLDAVAPDATQASGAQLLSALRSTYTRPEVECVRVACGVAATAFERGRGLIDVGMREPQVVAPFRASMETLGLCEQGVQRAGAFVWCMSGPNSALAGAAYARTRDRVLQTGDFVLVHCNSYIDGLWTDITRTYCLGQPDGRQQAMYEAVFAAREAALACIRPGARAAQVDAAARQVLEDHGFGQYFTHGLGHNVGFSAISGEFPPRIHPASQDVLQTGMTFNVEPSIYIHGSGGLRHCDVVTVTDSGVEVLTAFQHEPGELVLHG